MTLARRGILRGIGALLAAPVAASAATTTSKLPWAGLPSGGAPAPPDMPPITVAVEKFWARRNRRRSRLNDWDVDILAMKSWSPAFALLVAKEREEEAQTALHKIYKAFGHPLPPWLDTE